MRNFAILTALGILAATLHAETKWQPANGPLMTRWAKDVSPEKVLPEYPRPQMVRQDWQNLNGLWNYSITEKETRFNEMNDQLFAGQILVPFPIESALSGVMKPLDENHKLWYQRTFTIPKDWNGKRMLLHFGAVDWEATVFINRKKVGEHRGGYDGFSFDITDALEKSGAQEILVAVSDPSDAGPQPRGKQVGKPHGIWYTPTSGIWQTVWLEPLPDTHIEDIRITPDLDNSAVKVAFTLVTGAETNLFNTTVEVFDAGTKRASETFPVSGTPPPPGTKLPAEVTVKIPEAKSWSPESPFLYDLVIRVSNQQGNAHDEIKSYFGLRKISLGKDDKGVLRMLLNNKPYFQFGPLDQGFWPDGLYTAPTDEALRYDIEMTKKFGFNLARKHVKVEPERWYYWCDKLGLLVWQDMPSGDKAAEWKGPSGVDGKEITRTPESIEIYERELRALIAGRYNHPCIVTWVPFNEGWGQFDTVRILNLAKQLDPTRLVDGPSGGNNFPAGDLIDHHQYPGPGAPEKVTDRAMVLGEFGGLGLPVSGHTWQSEKNWGYRSFSDTNALTRAYVKLIHQLLPMIDTDGLSAAIYTQTTDVEGEVNGLMTYDRAMVKPDLQKISDANRGKFPPEPKRVVILPTSQEEPQIWQYSFTKPTNGCEKCSWYDTVFEGHWMRGPGGFGTRETPGAVIGTKWHKKDIWMRRQFDLTTTDFDDLVLSVFHDEDAEIYFNGVLAAKLNRYTSRYEDADIDPRAKAALKVGKNLVAVHCHQTTGGQYIDVGLVNLAP